MLCCSVIGKEWNGIEWTFLWRWCVCYACFVSLSGLLCLYFSFLLLFLFSSLHCFGEQVSSACCRHRFRCEPLMVGVSCLLWQSVLDVSLCISRCSLSEFPRKLHASFRFYRHTFVIKHWNARLLFYLVHLMMIRRCVIVHMCLDRKSVV